MKILNMILSFCIALMAGSCIYPEDILSNVSVSISSVSDESGVTVYGNLDSGNIEDVSECGFELFFVGQPVGYDNTVEVSISDFRHYYDYIKIDGAIVPGYSCRAYVVVEGLKVYSSEISIDKKP